ncbi:MAG: SMP-30/gluconolactonase/LRE family protein [Anaerolineae bacterium]|nr:SMP-30/gluconolactonase/LRE family protein [Anaerolineae bacterium]
MEPRMIVNVDCATGEGPLWHSDEDRVYWVDIPHGRLYRYDPATGAHELCFEGATAGVGAIGGFTIQEDGSLLLCMDKGAIAIWREGQPLDYIVEEIPEERNTRFNDVIAGPAGRVYCGTMPDGARAAHLYRLDTDGSLTLILDDVGLSNGMGFTPDRKHMYYTDTRKQKITLYDYDEATGALSNPRIFIAVPETPGEGHPDGMTVDAEGNVWSARWDGHCLVQYSPEGEELQRIDFPVAKVSCVTFGGPDTTDMYITTASVGNRAQEGPLAGALFHLNLGIKGLPEFRSKVRIDK